ncbi:MAG: hypothetical protein WC337_01955 [Candidatus Muiribacteriota bacterium]|jgi:hypothetical protein
MTREEYEEIIKTEHGKSMLRSVYVLAKLDKTNEIWDSKGNLKTEMLNRGFMSKETAIKCAIGVVIAGAILTGGGVVALGIYKSVQIGIVLTYLGVGTWMAGRTIYHRILKWGYDDNFIHRFKQDKIVLMGINYENY